MAISDYTIQPGDTPQSVERRRRIAQALAEKGMDASPIRSPWQGAARIAQGLIGGYQMGDTDKVEAAGQKAGIDAYDAALKSGSTDAIARAVMHPWAPAGAPQAAGMLIADRRHAADTARDDAWREREAQFREKQLAQSAALQGVEFKQGVDANGDPVWYRIDKLNKSVDPVNLAPQAQPGAPVAPQRQGQAMPPPPPGVPREVWAKQWADKEMDRRAGNEAAAGTAKLAMKHMDAALNSYNQLWADGAIGPYAGTIGAAIDKYGKDVIGRTKTAGIREAYNTAVKELELMKAQIRLKGQGQVTEWERKLLGYTFPQLDMNNPQAGVQALLRFKSELNDAISKGQTQGLSGGRAAPKSGEYNWTPDGGLQ